MARGGPAATVGSMVALRRALGLLSVVYLLVFGAIGLVVVRRRLDALLLT